MHTLMWALRSTLSQETQMLQTGLANNHYVAGSQLAKTILWRIDWSWSGSDPNRPS